MAKWKVRWNMLKLNSRQKELWPKLNKARAKTWQNSRSHMKAGNVFYITKRMMKERQDVVKVNCLKDMRDNVVVDEEDRKKIWKEYMEKLLNEENDWGQDVTCAAKEGSAC